MSDKDYKIRFAGEDVPAYQAWEKLEAANAALSVLENFNRNRFPLSTEVTRDTEQKVRRHLSEIELLLPAPPKKDADMTDKAKALLMQHSPEEAMDILSREHNMDCDIHGLIHLAGIEAYTQSLTNEATVLGQNAISPEQVATLWNEAKWPAPGKPFWDARAVRKLLGQE